MKRHFSLLAMTLLTAGLALVSCNDPVEPDVPDTPEVVEPVFPAAVTEALEAGGSYTLDMEPNADWSVELKYEKESTGWFWIQDGNSQVYSLRGKAGDKVAVTVCAGDQTDFDTVHSCTLEMTMGEKTQTIATFTRGTVGRTFSLAICKVEDDGSDFVWAEGGDYDFEYNEPLDGEKPEIPLVWLERTKDFRRSLIISANFDWQFKSKPEWLLDLKVTGGEAGKTVELELEGNPLAYPLEDALADIVFCAKENKDAEFAYGVSVPGCSDIFQVEGFTADTKANAAGEIYRENLGEGSWIPVEIGISGYVLGIEGAKAFASADWVTATLSDWTSDGGVLQERQLTVTVTANTAEEREAYVVVLPASAASVDAGAVFVDGKVADEYSSYIVTRLVQEGTGSGTEPGPGEEVEPITFQMTTLYGYKISKDEATLVEVTADNMETLGAGYKDKYGFNLSDFCTTSATYVLTYYPDVQQNMTALHIPDFSGETLQTICDPENGKEWLSYEQAENTLSVWMSRPEADASRNFGIIQLYISMERSYTIVCLPEL